LCLEPFVVVVVTGSVVEDVTVGAVKVVGDFVEANTADVTTSATNTVVSADRSGQFALLARGGLAPVVGPVPLPLASGCCRPSNVPSSCVALVLKRDGTADLSAATGDDRI